MSHTPKSHTLLQKTAIPHLLLQGRQFLILHRSLAELRGRLDRIDEANARMSVGVREAERESTEIGAAKRVLSDGSRGAAREGKRQKRLDDDDRERRGAMSSQETVSEQGSDLLSALDTYIDGKIAELQSPVASLSLQEPDGNGNGHSLEAPEATNAPFVDHLAALQEFEEYSRVQRDQSHDLNQSIMTSSPARTGNTASTSPKSSRDELTKTWPPDTTAFNPSQLSRDEAINKRIQDFSARLQQRHPLTPPKSIPMISTCTYVRPGHKVSKPYYRPDVVQRCMGPPPRPIPLPQIPQAPKALALPKLPLSLPKRPFIKSTVRHPEPGGLFDAILKMRAALAPVVVNIPADVPRAKGSNPFQDKAAGGTETKKVVSDSRTDGITLHQISRQTPVSNEKAPTVVVKLPQGLNHEHDSTTREQRPMSIAPHLTSLTGRSSALVDLTTADEVHQTSVESDGKTILDHALSLRLWKPATTAPGQVSAAGIADSTSGTKLNNTTKSIANPLTGDMIQAITAHTHPLHNDAAWPYTQTKVVGMMAGKHDGSIHPITVMYLEATGATLFPFPSYQKPNIDTNASTEVTRKKKTRRKKRARGGRDPPQKPMASEFHLSNAPIVISSDSSSDDSSDETSEDDEGEQPQVGQKRKRHRRQTRIGKKRIEAFKAADRFLDEMEI